MDDGNLLADSFLGLMVGSVVSLALVVRVSAAEVLLMGGLGATFSLLLLYIQIMQNTDEAVQIKSNNLFQ